MGVIAFLLITSKFEEIPIKVYKIDITKESDIKVSDELLPNEDNERISKPSFKVAVCSLKYWHTLGIGFFLVCIIAI